MDRSLGDCWSRSPCKQTGLFLDGTSDSFQKSYGQGDPSFTRPLSDNKNLTRWSLIHLQGDPSVIHTLVPGVFCCSAFFTRISPKSIYLSEWRHVWKCKIANSKESFKFVPERSIFPGQYGHFQFGKIPWGTRSRAVLCLSYNFPILTLNATCTVKKIFWGFTISIKFLLMNILSGSELLETRVFVFSSERDTKHRVSAN